MTKLDGRVNGVGRLGYHPTTKDRQRQKSQDDFHKLRTIIPDYLLPFAFSTPDPDDGLSPLV